MKVESVERKERVCEHSICCKEVCVNEIMRMLLGHHVKGGPDGERQKVIINHLRVCKKCRDDLPLHFKEENGLLEENILTVVA